MSRMAALVLMAVSAAPVAPAGRPVTAEQAMARYDAMIHGSLPSTPEACLHPDADEIVVCRRDVHPQPRLPMPDQRAEEGEVVHHLGEPPPSMAPGPPTGPPSKQMKTILGAFGLLKGAITGEDSGN